MKKPAQKRAPSKRRVASKGARLRGTKVLTDWDGARHGDDEPHRYIVKDQLPNERAFEDLVIAVAKILFSHPFDGEPLPDNYPAGEQSIETFLNYSLPLNAAVNAAENGDIEPLRKLCPPPFNRFLAAPTIDRRKRVKSEVKQDATLKAAAASVPRIKAILAEMFKGKRNPSAREVAAAIWRVNLGRLNKHMNKPGRSTKPRKQKVAKS